METLLRYFRNAWAFFRVFDFDLFFTQGEVLFE